MRLPANIKLLSDRGRLCSLRRDIHLVSEIMAQLLAAIAERDDLEFWTKAWLRPCAFLTKAMRDITGLENNSCLALADPSPQRSLRSVR